MSPTYQATGINLKSMTFGETDRLMTILTSEFGLIRAVAPGARKYKSRLRGKTELFVINQLLLAKGRSLDKITQADTIQYYSRLGQSLAKLTASQYLAELTILLAVSNQPQLELYEVVREHLERLNQLSDGDPIFAHLAQAVYHILAIAGIAPQFQKCCVTGVYLIPNFQEPNWQVGFSFDKGGLISLLPQITQNRYQINYQLQALELTLLQHLGNNYLPKISEIYPSELNNNLSIQSAWQKVERILRDYTQYYCGRSLLSSGLLDTLSYLN